MNATWFQITLDWIAAHPVLAGIVIFAIAFCDAVIVLGAFVPALPLIFAVGVMVGLGTINGPYAVICAALGAFAGDGISYWVGSRWGNKVFGIWPFSRYPNLLDRGENLFRRNAVKSIFIARYVGPIRPFVPAIAGMMDMPFKQYVFASGLAALSWALLFLIPGWVLGGAYAAVAAVAGRLLIVVGLLVVVLAIAWASVVYSYGWFARHADGLMHRVLAWSQRHPKLGRYSAALFNPKGRESVPLAVLAVMLLGLGWAWSALLTTVIARGEPLVTDMAVHELMLALRNPLADYPMAALASLGDWPVLIPCIGVGMGYLFWRRRWMAAMHWLAALAFGLLFSHLLGATVQVVQPPGASSGFGFPSITVTITTITFGFFAILIARELPGRRRVWPYLVSGVIAALIGFARIYLGAHWLSDVIGGILFGLCWLLVLGIAYRRRVNRSFWMKPLAWLFYGTFAAVAMVYVPRNIDAKLARFELPMATQVQMDSRLWWDRDWVSLPERRNDFDDEQRWPLDVQYAGSLSVLQAQLEAMGWRMQPQAGWEESLNILRVDVLLEDIPVLPATLDNQVESLLMLREGGGAEQLYVLRLWRAPVQLQPGDTPLWLGSAQTLNSQKLFNFATFWRPQRDAIPALGAVYKSLGALPVRVEQHPRAKLPVLRITTPAFFESALSEGALLEAGNQKQ